MNVYDFDNTIFYPNSLVKFVNFCVRRKPSLIFTFGLPFAGSAIKYAFGFVSKNKLFAKYHSFIKHIKNPDKYVELFWNKYEKNISEWYLKQKSDDDIIITGSPEYLIKPIGDRLGVKVIGTIVDVENGLLIGNIKLAKEKAKFFIDLDMPIIDNFYSDSISDTPLALLSNNAFLVVDHAQKPIPWPKIRDISKKVFKKIKLD